MSDAYTIAKDALTGAPGCQVEPRTYLHCWLSWFLNRGTHNHKCQPVPPSHDGNINGQPCSLGSEPFIHNICLDGTWIYIETSNSWNRNGRFWLEVTVLAVEMRHHQSGQIFASGVRSWGLDELRIGQDVVA
jgi:hypothetical protein